MRRIILVGFIFVFICSINIYSQSKLSAYSKFIVDKNIANAKYDKTLESIKLRGLVKVNQQIDENYLKSISCTIGTKAGNIWTISIPASAVELLALHDGIDYIDLDKPIVPTLYKAKQSSAVDKVHSGYGISSALKGRNVVVGIVDAGFEYSHPMFREQGTNKTRIRKVWELKNEGNPPDAYDYGNELKNEQEILSKSCDFDFMSHGSHVAGIAAGVSVGEDTLNGGVAPESDLVFVGIRPEPKEWANTSMSSIVDAFNYIFKYAEQEGKPSVINLSWGANIGPHDGKSLFNQACNNLTGPGKIITISAGNSGDNRTHFGFSFNDNDTIVKTFISTTNFDNVGMTWVDLWGDANKNPEIQFHTFDQGKSQVINSSEQIKIDKSGTNKIVLIGSDNDTCIIDLAYNNSEYNGKPHIFIDVQSKTKDKLMISIKDKSGNIHMWNDMVKNYTGYDAEFTSLGYSWARSGNTEYIVNDISLADSVICVAAYVSWSKWKNLDGKDIKYSTYYPPETMAGFSSEGPRVDGKMKPDIAAPGAFLLSAVNSLDTLHYNHTTEKTFLSRKYTEGEKDYYFAYSAGTSMSSPMAAGIIALMLEKNPKLAVADILRIFDSSAVKDEYYQDNNKWGRGKINAHRAILFMEDKLSVEELRASDITVYPNPANDIIHIGLADPKEYIYIEIFDMLGNKLYSGVSQSGNSSVDIAELPIGTYIVKLYNERIENIKMINIIR